MPQEFLWGFTGGGLFIAIIAILYIHQSRRWATVDELQHDLDTVLEICESDMSVKEKARILTTHVGPRMSFMFRRLGIGGLVEPTMKDDQTKVDYVRNSVLAKMREVDGASGD